MVRKRSSSNVPVLTQCSYNCLRLSRWCRYEESSSVEELLPTHLSGSDSRSSLYGASLQHYRSLSNSDPVEIPILPDITVILQSRRSASPYWYSQLSYISPLHANMTPSEATFLHHYQNTVSQALLGPQCGHKIALTEHFPRYLSGHHERLMFLTSCIGFCKEGAIMIS